MLIWYKLMVFFLARPARDKPTDNRARRPRRLEITTRRRVRPEVAAVPKFDRAHSSMCTCALSPFLSFSRRLRMLPHRHRHAAPLKFASAADGASSTLSGSGLASIGATKFRRSDGPGALLRWWFGGTFRRSIRSASYISFPEDADFELRYPHI